MIQRPRCGVPVYAGFQRQFNGGCDRPEGHPGAHHGSKSKRRFTANQDKGHYHGLTREERQALFAKHDGLCWVCLERPARVIDHDHACCPGTYSCGNCVRGGLCQACNVGIGHLEREGWLQLGLEYLGK